MHRTHKHDGGAGGKRRRACTEDVCDLSGQGRYREQLRISLAEGNMFAFPTRDQMAAIRSSASVLPPQRPQSEPSPDVLEAWLRLYYYLLNVGFVSQFMTDDIQRDLQSYKGQSVRYVNPIQADGKATERVSALKRLYRSLFSKKAKGDPSEDVMDNDADEEKVEEAFADITQEADSLWHVPLWSAGNPNGNGMFCRASVCHSMPDTLWLSFRPLNLADLEKLVSFADMHTYLRRFSGQIDISQLSHDAKTIDNLLYITLQLSTTDVDAETGLSQGYLNLLARSRINVTTENVVARLKSTVPQWPFNPAFGAKQEVPSIHDAIASFLQINRSTFKRVVFSGFSLGSGSALTSAVLAHRALSADGSGGPLPEFHVVQMSGTMVGTERVAAYAADNFASCLYLALRNTAEKGNDVYDPVTFMPYDTRFSHAGDHMVLDFARHDVFLTTGFDPSMHQRGSNPWIKLMASMVTGINLGGSYVGFSRTHLAGERMIVRTLLYNIVQQWKASSANKARRADGAAQPTVEVPKWVLMIPCEYYSIAGTAAKHKLCPDVMCMLTTRVVGDKPRALCIRNMMPSANAAEAVEPTTEGGGGRRGKKPTVTRSHPTHSGHPRPTRSTDRAPRRTS